MYPPVHLAVGYLAYAGYRRWRGVGPPDDRTALAVLFGAALPDLIDKPLLAAGVLPVGRALGHSLLFVAPLAAFSWLVASRLGARPLAIAYVIGLFAHVAADVPWHVLAGEYAELGFLGWPITPMPQYTNAKTLGSVAGVAVTTTWIEVAILVSGVTTWWTDGAPGLPVVGVDQE